MQEVFPLKHVLFFMKFTKLWLLTKFNITGFAGSKLSCFIRTSAKSLKIPRKY